MHNFKQYLEEVRDTPLYHAEKVKDAVDVIKTNMIDGVELSNENKWSLDKGNKPEKVVPLSRSFNSIKKSGYVVFEFDQRKLTQYNKVLTFNFTRDKTDRKSMAHKKRYGSYEEYVSDDIRDIDSSVSKIHMQRDEKLKNTYPELKNHPKLYIDGKFVNA